VGYSIEEARDAEGKRMVQKRENRIFDIKPDAKMTFSELSEWFLALERVKSLAYYPTLKIYLEKFNSEFGNVIVAKIKPADLENIQAKRKVQGLADSTIDQEIGSARTMVNKAFDNDLVGGDTLKAFKRNKKTQAKRECTRQNSLASTVQDPDAAPASTHQGHTSDCILHWHATR
jgi:hypothetical protein